MHKILVIEDDPDIHALVKRQLEGEGFSVTVVDHGERGMVEACRADYDLVLLDLNLPGMHGLEVCKGIRSRKPRLPIMMLTARGDEIDKVLGLELGADDYVTKPFSVREVLARIKALLRRSQVDAGIIPGGAVTEGKRTVGELVIDFEGRRVNKAGAPLKLTATEFDLLVFLINNPGRVFTREQLIENVWGYSSNGYERSVNTLMSRLRGKIEDDPDNPRYLITVWGVGYKFNDENLVE